jgi:hypothetical protein
MSAEERLQFHQEHSGPSRKHSREMCWRCKSRRSIWTFRTPATISGRGAAFFPMISPTPA